MGSLDYGSLEYWENRYDKQGRNVTFDWYFDLKSIWSTFQHYLPQNDPLILDLGCGNSLWPVQLSNHASHVLCIDYSSTVIRFMQRKHNISNLECKK